MNTTVGQEPEGTTLNVYSYVVKKGKPVGPREVMRGANLSSPSVAYWHLQKLENSGLLEKNKTGEYVVKEKTSISGHIWIGRNLVPRLMCYSLFFLGILIVETIIISVQFFTTGQIPNLALFYLLATNAIAFIMFLGEGLLLRKKAHSEKTATNSS
ncbi:MAG: hypothetical protein NWF06_01510 [Candidatus Bathyarchaeota archaeon]|nr:hypothetical protein [Candidatus Bathyarchaeum sp.]